LVKLVWDQGFKKTYQKKVKNNLDLKERFWRGIGLFSKNPFDRRLKTHKLTESLRDSGPLVSLTIVV
jgi:mRNA-degrading endonuclease YafQ of YafQ-DinJ toxin-antitoxin module